MAEMEIPSVTASQLLNMRDGNDIKSGEKILKTYKIDDPGPKVNESVKTLENTEKVNEQPKPESKEPESEVKTSIKLTAGEEPENKNPIDFDALLKEKSGGKFEKWDDIEKAIGVQPKQNQEFSFPDEQSKQIYDYLRDGKIEDVASYLNAQVQLSKLDSMDEETKIKMHLRYQHPTWDEDEIKDEYDTLYGGMDSDDKAEARRIKRTWKEDAVKAQEYLSSKRSEIKLPELPKASSSDNALSEQQMKELEQFRNSYLDSLKKANDEFKGYNVKVKDDDFELDASFNVPQQDKASFFKSLENFDLQSFFESNYFSEGKYNTQRLAQDLWLIQRDKDGTPNFQKMMSAMLKQVFSDAKLSVMAQFKGKDNNNPQSSPSGNRDVSRGTSSMLSTRV